jgi:hypothetical protein
MTGDNNLDSDSVTRGHCPTLSRALTHLIDDAQELVAGDTGRALAFAAEHFDVTTADAASLQAHEALVRPDLWSGELTHFHLIGAGLDCGAYWVCHSFLTVPDAGVQAA